MSNTVLLAWDKPAALADWQKEQGKPKLAPIAREMLLKTWIGVVFALALVLIFKFGLYQSIAIIVLPNAFSSYMYYRETKAQLLNTQQRYEIREDGIVIIGRKKPKLHPWKTVRNYQIEPITELSPFANLTVQIGPLFNREFITLGFDPTHIPESKLQAIFAQHLGPTSPVPPSQLTAASR